MHPQFIGLNMPQVKTNMPAISAVAETFWYFYRVNIVMTVFTGRNTF
jgi:hypothetical protein